MIPFMESHAIGHRAPVIGVEEFHELQKSSSSPAVLEVRRSKIESSPATVRVPTAVPVYLDSDLQGAGGGPRGSRPLPADGDLSELLQQWGVGDAGAVVYSVDGPAIAARAWLVLRLAGVSVSVLDLAADTRRYSGNAPVRSIEAEEVDGFVAAGVLLDSRSSSSYQGSDNHITGAVSAPATDLTTAGGSLRPPAELRDYFQRIGIGENTSVASYCGGGVAASLTALALASIGIPSSVYVASWSGWTSRIEVTDR